MRTLITGINGFTGTYLKKELELHGHEVIGLTSDLLDKEKLAQEIARINPQAVVHLAAIAYVAASNPEEFYRVNVIGTRNLLESLSKHAPNIQSILLASSANVYGNNQNEVLHEHIAPAPANDYAVSKLAMEYMAQLWLEHLPLFIVRPFNYTGVNQSLNFLIPKIVDHYVRKAPILELGNLDVWREFGDVRNVVAVYRKLLELKPIGKTINVATGKDYSLREILSLAEAYTNHHPQITTNPALVRKNEIRRLLGDNTVLKTLIGDWDHWPISETLKWMINEGV